MNVAISALGAPSPSSEPDWRIALAPHSRPRMVVDPRNPFQRRMYFFTHAYWERLLGLPFGRFADRELRRGDVFLDIGANVGFYTLYFGERVGGEGRVHAFEPEPRTFESLRRSVAENGFGAWVKCHHPALSDQKGTLPFHWVKDGSAHSLVAEAKGREDRYAGSIEVPVSTLDDVAEGLQLARVDLVKIDVEGEEPRTVRGMLRTLRATGLPPVWAEVRGPKGSTRAPSTYVPVRDTLAELGYEPFSWSERGLRPVRRAPQKRDDVLFVHPSRRPRAYR